MFFKQYLLFTIGNYSSSLVLFLSQASLVVKEMQIENVVSDSNMKLTFDACIAEYFTELKNKQRLLQLL